MGHNYTNETTFFPRGSNPSHLPFDIPGQTYVLLTMGTSVLAPKPLHTDRPCARIYGAFPTREDAMEHAQLVVERDPNCSMVVVQQDSWFLFPTTERYRDSPEDAEKRVQEKLQRHGDSILQEQIDFERAIMERRQRPDLPQSYNAGDPEEEREEVEAENLVYAPPKRIRAGAEVRGQAVVALVVIPDKFGEVLMKVLGCFESTGEADRWCQDVGSRHVTQHDIFVVPTCDWFYPNGIGKCTTNERYRIGELQRIMDAAKKNPQDVKDYKSWKKEQERLEEKKTREQEAFGNIEKGEGDAATESEL